jgi:hypothetical protein
MVPVMKLIIIIIMKLCFPLTSALPRNFQVPKTFPAPSHQAVVQIQKLQRQQIFTSPIIDSTYFTQASPIIDSTYFDPPEKF